MLGGNTPIRLGVDIEYTFLALLLLKLILFENLGHPVRILIYKGGFMLNEIFRDIFYREVGWLEGRNERSLYLGCLEEFMF